MELEGKKSEGEIQAGGALWRPPEGSNQKKRDKIDLLANSRSRSQDLKKKKKKEIEGIQTKQATNKICIRIGNGLEFENEGQTSQFVILVLSTVFWQHYLEIDMDPYATPSPTQAQRTLYSPSLDHPHYQPDDGRPRS